MGAENKQMDLFIVINYVDENYNQTLLTKHFLHLLYSIKPSMSKYETLLCHIFFQIVTKFPEV